MAKKIIVVLGMHRSGTSAITRGLLVAGVSLGDRLMPSVKGVNDKGFWEDLDVNELNIEMLRSLQSDWHHLSPISDRKVQALRENGFLLRAVELMRNKLSKTEIYGLKDPRIVKLLPFWSEVFRHCGFDVGYLIAVRNPLSVLRSLGKRDGFLPEKTYLLWLGHVIYSLTGSRGSKRLVVDYDQLMRAPEEQLTRLSKQFGLTLDQEELRIYETEFLEDSLQHSIFYLDDLSLDRACTPLVREIYETLLDVASDRIQVDDQTFINQYERWSREFAEIETALHLVDAYEVQLSALDETATRHDGQTANLSRLVNERDEQVHSLSQEVVQRDGQIADLSRLVGECDEQIHNLKQNLDECNG